MGADSGSRGIEQGAADEQGAEAGARGHAQGAGDEEGGAHVAGAAEADRLGQPDQRIHEPAAREQRPQATSEEPGRDHEGHDLAAHPLEHGLGPGRAVLGQEQTQDESREKDRPEAPLVGRALEPEPGDTCEEEGEGQEGPARSAPEAEGLRCHEERAAYIERTGGMR